MELLKCSGTSFVHALTKLFNAVYDSVCVPASEKQGPIVLTRCELPGDTNALTVCVGQAIRRVHGEGPGGAARMAAGVGPMARRGDQDARPAHPHGPLACGTAWSSGTLMLQALGWTQSCTVWLGWPRGVHGTPGAKEFIHTQSVRPQVLVPDARVLAARDTCRLAHARQRVCTLQQDQETTKGRRGHALSSAFQGLLPADKSVDFMGTAVRSPQSDWRLRADGALHDAWCTCTGGEPPC